MARKRINRVVSKLSREFDMAYQEVQRVYYKMKNEEDTRAILNLIKS